tara:strand:- start:343 stop:474 length:132 start_codon:yes stop_codon:yes gene_type:complete
MLKKINKLVGLKKTVFDDYVANNKIEVINSYLNNQIEKVDDDW